MKSKSKSSGSGRIPYYDYHSFERALELNRFDSFNELHDLNQNYFYEQYAQPIEYDTNLYEKAYKNGDYKIIQIMSESTQELPEFFLNGDLLEKDQKLLDMVLDKMEDYDIGKNTFEYLLRYYYDGRTKVIEYILYHSSNITPILHTLIKSQISELLEYILIHKVFKDFEVCNGFDLCVNDNYIDGVKLFIQYKSEVLDNEDLRLALEDAYKKDYTELAEFLELAYNSANLLYAFFEQI